MEVSWLIKVDHDKLASTLHLNSTNQGFFALYDPRVSRYSFCPYLPLVLFLAIPSFLFSVGSAEGIPLDHSEVGPVDDVTSASLYPPSIDQSHNPGFTESSAPKVLIVRADSRNGNLSEAIAVSLSQLFSQELWEVETVDLYEEGFNPIHGNIRFDEAPNHAHPLVARYQDLVQRANALVLVYPLWWKQPPSILKGWLEQVFTYSFAYEFVNGSSESVIGLLPGKKVLIVNLAAGSEATYQKQGYLRHLDLADESLFSTAGMELVYRHIIFSATNLSLADKHRALIRLRPLLGLVEPGYR
ncbi:MAG: NAD(P)H-dependent oxidoreductase [Spirochaetales bacterium]|nr:NAD(P)H-dependent oxidoreductase [Spirochaetales bacterium]